MNKNQFIGSLEADILEVVWKENEVTVRQVVTRLRAKKQVAYTTVMTVMTRLYGKGILIRSMGAGGAYTYRPSATREAFFAKLSKRYINDLIRQFGEIAVAQFIDVIENGDLGSSEGFRKSLKKIR